MTTQVAVRIVKIILKIMIARMACFLIHEDGTLHSTTGSMTASFSKPCDAVHIQPRIFQASSHGKNACDDITGLAIADRII